MKVFGKQPFGKTSAVVATVVVVAVGVVAAVEISRQRGSGGAASQAPAPLAPASVMSTVPREKLAREGMVMTGPQGRAGVSADAARAAAQKEFPGRAVREVAYVHITENRVIKLMDGDVWAVSMVTNDANAPPAGSTPSVRATWFVALFDGQTGHFIKAVEGS